MTVKSIQIENVKGIAKCELRMEGRSLIVIKGANASGKTSILDAVRMMFEPGGDPALIRHWCKVCGLGPSFCRCLVYQKVSAKSGKIVMTLSDGATVQKWISADGASAKSYKLEATSADGTPKMPSPKAYVDSLASSFAFDPLAFTRADKKKRIEFLMEAMPIEFSVNGVDPLSELFPVDTLLTLEQFDKARTMIYERRKFANSALKELDLTTKNLRKALPLDHQHGEVDLTAKIRNLTELKAAVDKDEAEAIAAVVAEANGARDGAREDYETVCAAAREKRDRTLAAIHNAEQEACDEARTNRAAEKESLTKQIADAQSQLAREGEIRALSSHLAEQTKRQGEKASEALALDRALEKLDALRKSKLETLPIPGLEVKDGEVWYNGIPFDQLNQAQQYVKAVEIGCLRMGDLPLVISDEAEHLDSEQWKEFCAAVEGSGLQVITARVEDGPLRAEPQGSLI